MADAENTRKATTMLMQGNNKAEDECNTQSDGEGKLKTDVDDHVGASKRTGHENDNEHHEASSKRAKVRLSEPDDTTQTAHGAFGTQTNFEDGKPSCNYDGYDDKEKDNSKESNSGSLGSDTDDLKGTASHISSSKSLFTFATSLASTKEYVCPFSKLLEDKKQQGFLETTAKVAVDIKATNIDNIQHDEANESLTKSCEIQNNVKDDETLLCENKSCALAYYKEAEWSTPIPVIMQLLEKKTKETKRIVCYQIGTGRLQLNSIILPTMSIQKLKTRSIIFVGQLINDETTLAPHRVTFPDQTQRDAFMQHF